jgi:hypothetical protein
MQRLRVLVNGRNMEAQRTANQEPLVKFGNVPIAVGRGWAVRSFKLNRIWLIRSREAAKGILWATGLDHQPNTAASRTESHPAPATLKPVSRGDLSTTQ